MPFLILMQGIETKHPSYVEEKLAVADGYDKAYRMLDAQHILELLQWIRDWKAWRHWSEDELKEMGLLGGLGAQHCLTEIRVMQEAEKRAA